MSITSKIFSQISKGRLKLLDKSRYTPETFQASWFKELISSGSQTSFGKEHNFGQINSIGDYQRLVPLRDYDAFEPYIERLRTGEDYVLWNKKVKWFAKSSGTSSSKSKFIPITDESLKLCHYEGMQTLLASYIDSTPNSQLFDGKALTLGGSITIDQKGSGNSHYGDLSAILLKNSPSWVELRRVPERLIALIPDFEEKIEKICQTVCNQNVTNFSGVPSWNLVLMNKILEYAGKSDLTQIWPNLELFMHGGTNFEPYRESYKRIIPKPQMNYRENYNASEGYFGFQDNPDEDSLLLLVNNGIFYEFIPMDRFNEALDGSYTAFETIESVKTEVNYAIVLTTNGGLWRYLIGDCVIFTSLKPHKIVISGRTQLFINAFGEELMINNAERALAKACEEAGVVVSNYTVAPLFMEGAEKGSHQWLIEFSRPPMNLEDFADSLDKNICLCNSDYEAKRSKNATMKRLTITPVSDGVFYRWMSERGKLGGQNKVPRLYNKRDYLEQLLAIDKKISGE
ncbi:MAG: GH3 auxin-responsive promoter family protein [Rikenellaceae bacterium]